MLEPRETPSGEEAFTSAAVQQAAGTAAVPGGGPGVGVVVFGLLLLASSLLLGPAAPGAAQAPAEPVVVLSADRSGGAAPAVRGAALEALAQQVPDPQHVVMLVHGWDTSAATNRRESREIALALQEGFRRQGERAGVLSLHWPSDAGPQRTWIPQTLLHYFFQTLGFRNAIPHPYKRDVPLARAVGLRGARQVLLDAHARFPHAKLHVLAHSLGSEVALHALDPNTLHGDERALAVPYEPGALPLDLVVLAGADVDQELMLRSQETAGGPSPGLLWVTLPERGRPRDRVLMLRKLARKRPALGDAGPKLRAAEIDALVGGRRLIFDTLDIPPTHRILNYYNADRLFRLAAAATALRTRRPERFPLLRALDETLRPTRKESELAQALRNQEASVRLYALWRLERLRCGNSRHLEDGSAFAVARLALRAPRRLAKLREGADCIVFREGIWPTQDLIAEGERHERGAEVGSR